jgi:hypothetical protein
VLELRHAFAAVLDVAVVGEELLDVDEAEAHDYLAVPGESGRSSGRASKTPSGP